MFQALEFFDRPMLTQTKLPMCKCPAICTPQGGSYEPCAAGLGSKHGLSVTVGAPAITRLSLPPLGKLLGCLLLWVPCLEVFSGNPSRVNPPFCGRSFCYTLVFDKQNSSGWHWRIRGKDMLKLQIDDSQLAVWACLLGSVRLARMRHTTTRFQQKGYCMAHWCYAFLLELAWRVVCPCQGVHVDQPD